LVCPNDGPVNDAAGLVDFQLQGFEHGRPNAALRPVREPVVHGLPRTEALWKVTPWDPRACAVQNRVYERTIPERRLWAATLLGKNVTESLPLFVGKRVAVHPDV
jgi:hypothetical protein